MERVFINSKRLEEILSLPIQSRTERESSELEDLFSRFQFFAMVAEQYKSDFVLKYTCHLLLLEKTSAKSTIYSVNERADSIYLILKGSVDVVPGRTRNPSSQNLLQYGEFKGRYGENKPIIGLNASRRFRMSQLIIEQPINLCFANGKTYNITDSFGEEPYYNKIYREGTAVTNEPCVFAVLQKVVLKNAIKRFKDQKLQELKFFLHNLKFFSSWSKATLTKISSSFIQEEIYKNQYIYRQGDIPDYVYFVKKGEFVIVKNLKSPQKNDTNESFVEGSRGNMLRLTRMKQKNKESQVFIAIKGVNELLGSEEVVNGDEFRKNSCMCSTDIGEVVKISKENFLNKLMYPDAIATIKHSIKSVENWETSRVVALERLERAKRSLDFHEFSPNNLSPAQKNKKLTPERFIKRITHSVNTKSNRDTSLSPEICKQILKLGTSRRKLSTNSPPETKKHFKYIIKKDPPPSFLIAFRENLSKSRNPQENKSNISYTLPF